MTRPRTTTVAGRLARLGFQNVEHSAEAVERLGEHAGELLDLVAAAADPDQALSYLADLADRDPELPGELVDQEDTATLLLAVLGSSAALGDHLLRHPDQWRELSDPALASTRPSRLWLRSVLLTALGADPTADCPIATLPDAEAMTTLRVEYRRQLLKLAARDMSGRMGVDDVAAELSDLAGAALEGGLAIARARVGAQAQAARLAVIAMGSAGATSSTTSVTST